MEIGTIFDVKEFAVYDGPGVRVTVFLKGCPLRCLWCHNPEGQPAGGAVTDISGSDTWTSGQVIEKLKDYERMLKLCSGGVTFSGGEPMMQAPFLAEVLDGLGDVHTAIETSGYSDRTDFVKVVSKLNTVYIDVKLIDREQHLQYTGVDNTCILDNIRVLSGMNIPYIVRVPLIPGITDTDENLRGIAEFLKELHPVPKVELLPYNPLTKAKYDAIGQAYKLDIDLKRKINQDTCTFKACNISCRIL